VTLTADADADADAGTHARRLPPEAAPLAPYVAAGIFDDYEVHLVASFARRHPALDDEVALALALAARAPRFGHVCTTMQASALPLPADDGDTSTAAPPPWPAAESWERRLHSSALVADGEGGGRIPLLPLVWDRDRLYLQRLWHDEVEVANELRRRCQDGNEPDRTVAPTLEDAADELLLDSLFAPSVDPDGDAGGADSHDQQRLAARRGLRYRISIIAGGPGTGKTHTVARVLAATYLSGARDGRPPSVALAAPTGKAANRMSEAVAAAVAALAEDGVIDEVLAAQLASTPAVTIHRLLGARGDATFFHHRHRPLPHDLVIVDETSMVSLPLLADLVSALRPEARLVLVGDPSQLTSIEAGTVMSDLVGPYHEADAEGHAGLPRSSVEGALADRVTVLDRAHRYAADSGIASLAAAVRGGHVEETIEILGSGLEDVRWVRPEAALGTVEEEVIADGLAMMAAARAGDAADALEIGNRTKVLCALRGGPAGREAWGDRIRSAVLGQTSIRGRGRWYVGRPIMVTANDPVNRLYNGDVGVAVDHDGRLQVAMRDGHGIRLVAPAQFDQFDEWWAMTIHKSQGSEFGHAVIVLPEAGSPILSRELLYTGVTRARDRLTVVAGEEALRAAVGRPVARASGLADRLWGSTSDQVP
jgi:exodeoxyribonuclease V alpha subunit